MDGYKGYRLERRPDGTKVIVSPLGADVASLVDEWGEPVPMVFDAVDGLAPRDRYRSETEIVKDLADQHRPIQKS